MPKNTDEERKYKWSIKNAIIPVAVAIIGAVGIGAAVTINVFINRHESSPTPPPNQSIQTINFHYSDTPINHGWSFVDGDISQVVFNPIYENQKIEGIEVTTPVRWGMDFGLEPSAMTFGKALEFAIVPRQDAVIYALINLGKSDGTNKTGWLQFVYCNNGVTPIIRNSLGSDEWQVCVTPISHEGDWLLFRVDLIDAVKKTFSTDGWSFQGLNKIRIRGNLSLDYISIYE